jgi:enoyl-CoA hydratase
MITYRFLEIERRGDIAIVTLSRPDRYNAWHAPMRAEVAALMRELNADPAVRAIVLTGAGDKAFSAGQDLSETQQFDAERGARWLDEWHEMYGAIRALDKPLVAALNGVAAGSAFQVALLCDVRVGHGGSRMGQPEINAGLPSTTGPWLMEISLGVSRMVELTLTGRMMEAEECHRIGLIHHLVRPEEVLPKALEVARELAGKSPVAMRLNKQRFREITEAGFMDALAAGKRIQREAFATGEPQAMMAEFFAARRAHKGEPAR